MASGRYEFKVLVVGPFTSPSSAMAQALGMQRQAVGGRVPGSRITRKGNGERMENLVGKSPCDRTTVCDGNGCRVAASGIDVGFDTGRWAGIYLYMYEHTVNRDCGLKAGLPAGCTSPPWRQRWIEGDAC